MSGYIILVDDERHLRTACTQALELAGFSVTSFASADGALDTLDQALDGILITDIKMPGIDGLELMRRALDIDPQLPVILITGHGDVPMAVQAIRDGAYDFIEKPFASEFLVDAAKRAMEKRRLVLENRQLREDLANCSGIEQTILGRAPAIERLRQEIVSIGATDTDVLVTGETGTGKELVARNLHRFSSRRDSKFVAVNCGALPETIIESELFGHEAGAFTGAAKLRIGKFEHAHRGTLLLDEIESMPMDLQVKLLRVLQERVIERLGSNEEIPIDIRIIAATKKDLREACRQGIFREDLYYRLNVIVLEVPPLRERLDDVSLLFHHFVSQTAARYRRDAPDITGEVLGDLLKYDWPGNVRELQNAAQRFALGLGADFLAGAETSPGGRDERRGLPDRIAIVEKQLIESELKHQGGNLKATYEALSISRKTLYDKMRKYGLGRQETP